MVGGMAQSDGHECGVVTGAADDMRGARGLDGFWESHRRSDGGEPADQHRLARTGWTQEQQIMVIMPV
jgi:hypothetical protein